MTVSPLAVPIESRLAVLGPSLCQVALSASPPGSSTSSQFRARRKRRPNPGSGSRRTVRSGARRVVRAPIHSIAAAIAGEGGGWTIPEEVSW